ncbi:MAG: hypothetical protein E7588_07680 [Ruminococcaceae bacterium]|nr:hypothetical protein [Oscillospiraceae bacterium]
MKKTILPFFCIFTLFILIACTTIGPELIEGDNDIPNETNDFHEQITGDEQSSPTDVIYDYNARDFTIAMYNDSLFLPQANSSPISNKILERNAKVEKAYNINIKSLEGVNKDNFVAELHSRYAAGLFCGDLLVIPNYMLPLFVSQNQLMSVKALPYTDLSADCFDKAAIDSATIGNFVHAVYGDLTYLPDKSTCVFFNKDFVQEYNLLSPYEMEKKGTWTWDSFDVLAKAVIKDVNNNRIADFDDIYGLCSSYSRLEMVDIMWASCGEPFFENNPPYAPKMIFNNEKTKNIIDKIRRLLYNEVDKIYIYGVQGLSGYELFLQGRGLFCIAPLDKASEISAAGLNFGIMPLPRLTKKTDFRSYMDDSADAVCVMNNIPDSEFSGRILQKLASESSFNNIDYYKKYYVTNFLTDNSSALMMDEIFKNPYYDLATTLGACYPEIAAASDEIIFSHLATGISFDTLYEQNIQPFESFAKTSFTHKGE